MNAEQFVIKNDNDFISSAKAGITTTIDNPTSTVIDGSFSTFFSTIPDGHGGLITNDTSAGVKLQVFEGQRTWKTALVVAVLGATALLSM